MQAWPQQSPSSSDVTARVPRSLSPSLSWTRGTVSVSPPPMGSTAEHQVTFHPRPRYRHAAGAGRQGLCGEGVGTIPRRHDTAALRCADRPWKCEERQPAGKDRGHHERRGRDVREVRLLHRRHRPAEGLARCAPIPHAKRIPGGGRKARRCRGRQQTPDPRRRRR